METKGAVEAEINVMIATGSFYMQDDRGCVLCFHDFIDAKRQ